MTGIEMSYSMYQGHQFELGNIKRFLERYSYDVEFRERVESQPGCLVEIARSIGCMLNPRDFSPVWEHGFSKNPSEWSKDYPAAILWYEYINATVRLKGELRSNGDPGSVNRPFSTWRKRQINRARGELGVSSKAIVHATAAFELSDGCTVGCWFCGVSAQRFSGHYEHEKNQEEWLSVLSTCKDYFGAESIKSSFLYWATDPLDNPDYPKFLLDYRSVVGSLPQTTTARPLKNLSLTRETLSLYEFGRDIINRFSVLTLSQLRKIHAEFTAEEMAGVEIVYQADGGIIRKAVAGKAYKEMPLEESPQYPGTIACVTGLLVNLCKKTIRLVTPTKASQETKDGFYVIGEFKYTTAVDFKRQLELLHSIVLESHNLWNKKVKLNQHANVVDDGDKILVKFGKEEWTLPVKNFSKLEDKSSLGDLYSYAVESGLNQSLAASIIQELYLGGVLREGTGLIDDGIAVTRAGTVCSPA